MRVLITLHQGGGSGAVNSTLHLALGLAARGVRVHLVCPPGSWVEQEARSGGLEVHPVELISRRRWRNAALLRTVIDRHPVDLVNAQSARDREALTLLAWRRQLHRPLVFTRRSWPRSTWLESWLANRAADRVIAVSEPVRDELVTRGISADKVVVVHNGVITARLDRPVSPTEVEAWRRRIGWEAARRTVGIVARPKDQAVVLSALARLQTPVRLVLSGLTPDALDAPLPAIPERHAVVRLPFDPEVRPLYELLEVVLHPSRYDALPQAVLEALALGKPVIASRATGNAVIIRHALDGLLAAPEDPRDWAEQLDLLLTTPALADRLSAAGRRRARQDFSLDQTVEQTLAVYRLLVSPDAKDLGGRGAAGPGASGRARPTPLEHGGDLLLAYDFPPRGGGIARALGELARHSRGRLTVCTGAMPGGAEWDRGAGLPVVRAEVPSERLRTLGGLLRWVRTTDELVRQRQPGVLWAGNLKPAGHVARAVGRRHRIPYGLLVYGLDLGIVAGQARRSSRKRHRARLLFRDAAEIVACSEWTAERCRALLDQLDLAPVAGRIRVIPLGADPDRFRPTGPRFFLPEGRWLLTVARLVPHKGIDTGIEALAGLHRRFPDLGYVVAGVGPDRERLTALARQLGVGDRVILLGAVGEPELPSLYRAAVLYLGLSREAGSEAEGFGLALAEAQASGLAVVASASGGIPETVGGGAAGLLVPPASPDQAAAAIALLLEDPARRAAFGEVGRRRVEQGLNWTRVVEDFRRASLSLRERHPGQAARAGR